MALPEQLDRCPREKGCTSQSVWKDPDTGELYSVRMDNAARNPLPKFHPHVCTSKAVEVPTTMFAAKWYNLRTGYYRYVGPQRMQRSVLRSPVDKTPRKNSERDEWRLVELLEAVVEWKVIDIPDDYKTDVKMKEEASDEAATS